jgi:hypothetical protein
VLQVHYFTGADENTVFLREGRCGDHGAEPDPIGFQSDFQFIPWLERKLVAHGLGHDQSAHFIQSKDHGKSNAIWQKRFQPTKAFKADHENDGSRRFTTPPPEV